MKFRVGVRPHGDRPENAVWGFWSKQDKKGHCRVSHSLMGGEGGRRDKHFTEEVKNLFGPILEQHIRILRDTDPESNSLRGQYLYIESDEDFSDRLGIAAACLGMALSSEEDVLALASGLCDFLEYDTDKMMRDQMAKAVEKKEFKTTETFAVEMTVASESFKITLSKGSGDLKIQNREAQNNSFSLAKTKLDEFIEVLTKVRDQHGPRCDAFGEE